MLGTKRSYSIIDIARMFKSRIKYLPERPGDRLGSTITNNNALEILGYKPKKKIEDYIQNFISKK
jgi:UDP-glucose 4-epimerase